MANRGFETFLLSRFLRTMASNYFPQVSLLQAAATRVPLFSFFFFPSSFPFFFFFFLKIVFLFTFPSLKLRLKRKILAQDHPQVFFFCQLSKKRERKSCITWCISGILRYNPSFSPLAFLFSFFPSLLVE